MALQFSCAAPQTWGSRNASVASVAGTVMAGESSAKRNADRERVQRVETRKAEVAAQRERMPSQSRQVNPRGRDRGELWTRWISKPGKERPRVDTGAPRNWATPPRPKSTSSPVFKSLSCTPAHPLISVLPTPHSTGLPRASRIPHQLCSTADVSAQHTSTPQPLSDAGRGN